LTVLLLAGSAGLGLVVGSFLNVVVHRVPIGASLSRPGSSCPSCAAALAWRDNIPVVSWLVLGGRCRSCRARISVRYPTLEAATAVLWVAVALRFGASWTTPAVDAFGAGLLALSCIDLERYLLPKRVVYPTAAVSGVFLAVATLWGREWHRLLVAGISGGLAFGLFFALNWFNSQWLGFGDVRLAGVIGLVLGWLGLPYLLVGLLAANLSGLAVAVGLLALGRMKRGTPIPYGVFLSAGSMVAVLAGAPLSRLLTSYRV
jgi:leader peptidase (prepilin peptidase)/N-methyltransferase